MRNGIVRITPEEMRMAQSLHDPVARLSRRELLTIQFTKLINYFRDDLEPEWGGGSHEDDHASAERGLQCFLEDAAGFAESNAVGAHWLHKKLEGFRWGPDNFRLEQRADPNLGYPYEPYLTVNGAILTLNQASRVLSVDKMRLVAVKCSLLTDIRVVRFAITEMLNPRPLWPRVKLKRGGKGRSYRFD